jgi:hypothetical protein
MDASPGPRLLTELTRGQSLRLLSSVRLGRIVFTDRALPAIRAAAAAVVGDMSKVIRISPEIVTGYRTNPAP